MTQLFPMLALVALVFSIHIYFYALLPLWLLMGIVFAITLCAIKPKAHLNKLDDELRSN